MKKLFFVLLTLISLNLSAQDNKKKQLKDQEVEASCGMCQFGAKDKDCALAIRYEGAVYSVVGTDIDKHGDAHAKDGFCNAIRKAKVSGTLKKGKLLVKKFELQE